MLLFLCSFILMGGVMVTPPINIEQAEAGATWWMEEIEPGELDALRAKIKRGPRRVE